MTQPFNLYHYPLSPFCRKLRLVLSEKKIDFTLIEIEYWKKSERLLNLNPAGNVPVLFANGKALSESHAICEYIDTVYPEPPLMPEDPLEQHETRRLVNWFDEKLYREVTWPLIFERIMRKVQGLEPPNASRIIRGCKCRVFHLEYMNFLLDRRRWMAGDRMTLADFTAAAHVSCLDVISEINWNEQPILKNWYAIMKSRPAFQPILKEIHPGFQHPPWYADLDF